MPTNEAEALRSPGFYMESAMHGDLINGSGISPRKRTGPLAALQKNWGFEKSAEDSEPHRSA
jgi:hypothetical protein